MEKRVKIKGWLSNKYNVHYLFYVFCVFIFYIVNFFRVNGGGAQWAFYNELIGVIVFGMVMLRMRDIKGSWIPFIVNTIVFALAFAPYFQAFSTGTDYDWKVVARYVNLYLCFVVAIKMYVYLFRDGLYKKVISKTTICFAIWMLLVCFCLISKNSSSWPFWALVILTSFYIAPLEKEEKKALINGLVDGIIICFFVYQGLALLHRPYERVWIRYCSFFSNSDCSAKFFTISYVGFLVKFFILKRKNASAIYKVCTFLFMGAMWGFMFFTMTRSGFIGMMAATLAFFVIEYYGFEYGWKKLVKQVFLLVLVSVVSIPVVFVSIRYIPALRHHPIFIGEYNDNRVFSNDPIDSWKYAKFSDVIDTYLRRMAPPVEVKKDDSSSAVNNQGNVTSIKPEDGRENQNTNIKLSKNGERVLAYSDGVRPGADENHVKYVSITYSNWLEKKLRMRKYIYEAYFIDAGWFGNSEEYVAEYVDSEHVYTSAHNSLLDFMSRYGYIAGFFYLLFQVSIFMWGFKQIKEEGRNADEGVIMATIVGVAYFSWGIFYSVAFTGEIMDTVFWLVAVFVMKRNVECV